MENHSAVNGIFHFHEVVFSSPRFPILPQGGFIEAVLKNNKKTTTQYQLTFLSNFCTSATSQF